MEAGWVAAATGIDRVPVRLRSALIAVSGFAPWFEAMYMISVLMREVLSENRHRNIADAITSIIYEQN